MNNITLVPIQHGHIDKILEIEMLAFSEPWSRGAFSFILKDERSLFIVALLDDEVIGYAGIYIVIEEANLDSIAVHPEYTGRGVAKAMLSKLIACAKELGMKTITLEVRESNKSAIGLYEFFGFYEVGKRPGYYKNPEENAVLMDLVIEE